VSLCRQHDSGQAREQLPLKTFPEPALGKKRKRRHTEGGGIEEGWTTINIRSGNSGVEYVRIYRTADPSGFAIKAAQNEMKNDGQQANGLTQKWRTTRSQLPQGPYKKDNKTLPQSQRGIKNNTKLLKYSDTVLSDASMAGLDHYHGKLKFFTTVYRTINSGDLLGRRRERGEVKQTLGAPYPSNIRVQRACARGSGAEDAGRGLGSWSRGSVRLSSGTGVKGRHYQLCTGNKTKRSEERATQEKGQHVFDVEQLANLCKKKDLERSSKKSIITQRERKKSPYIKEGDRAV